MSPGCSTSDARRLARPAQLVPRDPPLPAFLQHDVGGAGLDRGHRRELPAAASGRIGNAGQRGLRRCPIRKMGQRTAPAMAPVVIDEPVAERLVGHLLVARHVARTHRQAALIDRLFAEPADQLAPHLFGEIAVRLALRLLQMHGERLRHRRLRLLRGDPAEFRHAGQHPIAARLRRLVVAQRIVVVRRLRQGRDERRLG